MLIKYMHLYSKHWFHTVLIPIPGDYIVYAGDMGREMYCVRRGLVEVIGDDDVTVVSTLGPGAYFGEVKNGFIGLLPLYDTIVYSTQGLRLANQLVYR